MLSNRMRGVAIHDGTGPGEPGYLTFDLLQLIEALGTRARAARWRVLVSPRYVSDADVAAFDSASDGPGPWISGEQLLAQAREIHQVIDGEFQAFDPSDVSSPWLVLRAVDSSWWEVHSDDPGVEAALRSAFRDIRPTRYPLSHLTAACSRRRLARS